MKQILRAVLFLLLFTATVNTVSYTHLYNGWWTREWESKRNNNASLTTDSSTPTTCLLYTSPYETESDYEFRDGIYEADPLIVEAVDTLGIVEVRKLRYITNNLKDVYKRQLFDNNKNFTYLLLWKK